MNKFRNVVLIILLAAVSAYSQTNSDLKAAIDTLNWGFNSWNSQTMERAREMLLLSGKKDACTSYYIALADYRLSSFYLRQKDTRAAKLIEEGEKYLESAANEKSPIASDLYALEAGLLNMEIAVTPQKAANLGYRINELLSKAEAADDSNPRVWLYKGLSQFYTPPAYGGGPVKARESLMKAVELFAGGKADSQTCIDYGYDEALTWIGMTYLQEGNIAEARKMFEKALTVNPQSGYAKSQLMALDAKEEKAK